MMPDNLAAERPGALALLLTPCAVDAAAGCYDFPATTEPWPRIYGGQLLGQACAAAGATVPSDLALHSFHAYFLGAGDPGQSVAAHVEHARDGRRFVVRAVTIVQGEHVLLRMTASYHSPEPGWHASLPMPCAAAPDTLETDRERVFARLGDLPREVAPPDELLRDLDYRIAEQAAGGDAAPPSRRLWVRATSRFPVDRRMREAIVAYLSDFTLIGAALIGHRADPDWCGIRGGSLDHSMWLHGDPDPANWLLFDQTGLWSGGARALAQGRLHDQAGEAIATVMQEALIRPA